MHVSLAASALRSLLDALPEWSSLTGPEGETGAWEVLVGSLPLGSGSAQTRERILMYSRLHRAGVATVRRQLAFGEAPANALGGQVGSSGAGGPALQQGLVTNALGCEVALLTDLGDRQVNGCAFCGIWLFKCVHPKLSLCCDQAGHICCCGVCVLTGDMCTHIPPDAPQAVSELAPDAEGVPVLLAPPPAASAAAAAAAESRATNLAPPPVPAIRLLADAVAANGLSPELMAAGALMVRIKVRSCVPYEGFAVCLQSGTRL